MVKAEQLENMEADQKEKTQIKLEKAKKNSQMEEEKKKQEFDKALRGKQPQDDDAKKVKVEGDGEQHIDIESS